MTTVYVYILVIAIVGPASFGLVALAMLGVRATWFSAWGAEPWSKSWYRLADAVRNPLTLAFGYRNLEDSAWRWHLAAAALALTPIAALFGVGLWHRLRREGIASVTAANFGAIAAMMAMLVVAVQQLGVVFPSADADGTAAASRVGFGIAVVSATALLGWAVFSPRVYSLRALLLAFALPTLPLLAHDGPMWDHEAGLLGATLAGMLALGTLGMMWHGTHPPPITTADADGRARYPVPVAGAPTEEPATSLPVAEPATRTA